MHIESRRLIYLIAVFGTPTISATLALAQDAESGYRERYQIVGEMARASVVCATSDGDVKWFLKGLDAIKSAELRAFSKSFKETTGDWMRSGGESFNRKVMSEGIPGACAFARSERARALQLAGEPIAVAAHNDDQYEGDKSYAVVFSGSCNFKMLNRDRFAACDPNVTFTNYKVHRSAFEFSGSDGKALFVFEGGHERQPDLENYFLKIDKIKIGTVTNGRIDGVQGSGEGECHMHQNADASQFYEVKCDVFDRKTRMVYNFYLTSINHFDMHRY